jgi:hypothetical protein
LVPLPLKHIGHARATLATSEHATTASVDRTA